MPQQKLIAIFFILCTFDIFALDGTELLPPEQVFKASAAIVDAGHVEVNWTIAEGYSLYKKNMRFSADPVKFGEAEFPAGKIKHDEILGDIEHYRDRLSIKLPVVAPVKAGAGELTVRYQGCADIGVCYPPQEIKLPLNFVNQGVAESNVSPIDGLVKGVSSIKAKLNQDELLPPDEAFQASASVINPTTINVSWQIAKGYYLYREKTFVNLVGKINNKLGAYELPHGIPKEDEAFGHVEIFYDELNVDVPVIRSDINPQKITLQVKYQGCADIGVCYPPMEKELSVDLPSTVTESLSAVPADSKSISEQDQIINSLHHDSLWATLVSFFGFGLLLAFTPCIFPMIPILSGIIVGKGHSITTSRAFLLSFSYVLASALTYTLFGVLAALFGSNLQAVFQQPWIIGLFSAIFVLLSLSMFGFYNLDLPESIRAKLHRSSEKHRDGTILGAFIMGALSSLIVGPCVAAPLAGALIYIGKTGDVLLGGSALFVMGLGMGLPLLLIGTSAGKILPKAGSWLNTTKAVFGVVMLAVAVWMLSRVLPPTVTMVLWALLLILPAIYLNAIDPLPENSSGWQKLWKGLGLVLLTYGILLLIGVSMGNTNPLKPLQGFSAGTTTAIAAESGLKFDRVKTLDELNARINQASAKHKPVMLDFYADWCISCKEMEAYTFTDVKVKQALASFVLLQADVTENNENDKALLAKFNLIGPPATLFFNGSAQENSALRVIGYQDAETFIKTVQQAKQ